MIPNQLFNQPEFFGKTINSMTQRLLIVLVLLLTCVGVQAQAGRSASAGKSSIMHVDQYLASLRQDARQTQASKVEGLINDLNPSVYVKSGEVKTYGDNSPVVLYTDAASMQAVRNLNQSQRGQVVMATVKLPAKSQRVDLSVFSDFPKLEYIFIQSEAPITGPALINLVENTNPNQQVFYSIHEIN